MPARGFARAKAAFNKDKTHLSNNLNLRRKPVKCYIWSIDLFDAETLSLRKIDQKYMESFEMWCWRGLHKISSTGRVRNEGLGAIGPHKPHHCMKVCIPSEGTHTACNIPVVHKCLRV